MLKLILSILVLAFFTLRAPLCYFIYPNMVTSTGDWDGSNALTMNIYAGIIMLSVLISTFKTKYFITDYFQYVTFLLCASDILDRMLGIYSFGTFDLVYTIPICFLLPSIYYLLKYARSRKRINQ